MPIVNLLKSQSNKIYLTLVEAGWDVSTFEWSGIKSPNFAPRLSAILKHKTSRADCESVYGRLLACHRQTRSVFSATG